MKFHSAWVNYLNKATFLHVFTFCSGDHVDSLSCFALVKQEKHCYVYKIFQTRLNRRAKLTNLICNRRTDRQTGDSLVLVQFILCFNSSGIISVFFTSLSLSGQAESPVALCWLSFIHSWNLYIEMYSGKYHVAYVYCLPELENELEFAEFLVKFI